MVLLGECDCIKSEHKKRIISGLMCEIRYNEKRESILREEQSKYRKEQRWDKADQIGGQLTNVDLKIDDLKYTLNMLSKTNTCK